jgi:hypothetical protein
MPNEMKTIEAKILLFDAWYVNFEQVKVHKFNTKIV